jgi:16S rRNA U1498 N3-methylase RsmE
METKKEEDKMKRFFRKIKAAAKQSNEIINPDLTLIKDIAVFGPRNNRQQFIKQNYKGDV